MKNNIEILKNINATFHDGEITGIIGESGSGKTFLIKSIAGQFKKYNGEILINNKSVKLLSSKDRNKYISSLFTKLSGYIIDDTVFNFLLQSRKMYKKKFNPFSDLDWQITEEYMNLFQLTPHKDKKVLMLSDGIFKRTLLASTFIKNTDILLFDNPTNDLDLQSIQLLEKAIIKYVMNGNKVIIISSNDLNFILQIADKLLVMKEGRIDSELNPHKVDANTIKKYFRTEVLLSRNIYNGRPGIQQFSKTEG